MRPTISLDEDVLRENARLWRRYAGVPVWAVVKAEGYGCGSHRLVEALDRDVDGYVVADPGEAREIRDATARPIALLAASPPAEIPALLEEGIIPNVASLASLEAAAAWGRAAGRPASIRVGIVPAAGWSGLVDDASIAAFASAAGRVAEAVEIDLWTHLTVPSLQAAQRARFAVARTLFHAAGARVVGTDVAGTYACAAEGPSPDSRVRIGIGLFGALAERGGPPVRCAIRIDAPVVDVIPSGRVAASGYREPEAFTAPWLVVVRCGYSDGFPGRLAGSNEIVSVGMQYAVLARTERQEIGEVLRLLDTSSDIRTFLGSTGISPHEFVVGFKFKEERSRARSVSENW